MPRHHVVPQLMLRRFADDAERIVMADRDTPHRTVTTKVRTAAAENGFYRIDNDDVEDGHREGHDPGLVEKALSGVEGAAAGPLADLIEGRLPSLEDRLRIALLVALQAVRGQGFRDEMERIATLSAKTHLRGTVTDDKIGAGWPRRAGRSTRPTSRRSGRRCSARGTAREVTQQPRSAEPDVP